MFYPTKKKPGTNLRALKETRLTLQEWPTGHLPHRRVVEFLKGGAVGKRATPPPRGRRRVKSLRGRPKKGTFEKGRVRADAFEVTLWGG